MKCLILGVLALTIAATSHAGVTFCNKWNRTVYFAVAYESGGGYTTRGWMPVDPNGCRPFVDMPKVAGFYWLGESDWFKNEQGQDVWAQWGGKNGTKFGVGEYPFGQFTFTHAERGNGAPRMELMERFPATDSSGDLTARLTLNMDGSFTSERPADGARSAKPEGGPVAGSGVSIDNLAAALATNAFSEKLPSRYRLAGTINYRITAKEQAAGLVAVVVLKLEGPHAGQTIAFRIYSTPKAAARALEDPTLAQPYYVNAGDDYQLKRLANADSTGGLCARVAPENGQMTYVLRCTSDTGSLDKRVLVSVLMVDHDPSVLGDGSAGFNETLMDEVDELDPLIHAGIRHLAKVHGAAGGSDEVVADTFRERVADGERIKKK
jgi:hypothetical protein